MNQLLLFILFFTTILILFTLMQYRLYRVIRLWASKVYAEPARSRWLRRSRAIILVLNLLFLSQMVVRGTTVYESPLIQFVLVYPMGLFFAIVVFSFLIVSVVDILRLMFNALRRLRTGSSSPVSDIPQPDIPPDAGRRRFLKLGGLSTASAISAVPILASAQTARDYQVNKLSLSYAGLPTGLNGFTIAHVSDIHSGIYMTEKNMREIFELVNSLGAQTIVVTGDFVDSSDSQIEPLAKALQMLKAEYGLYGCLGNHDHFATVQRVAAAVEQCGVTLLKNSHASLTIDGDALSLVGIDDAGRGQSNFADWHKALNGLHPDSFKIALTHRPDQWDQSRSLGMDLTLAGHTHGGQVGFQLGPLNLNPVYLVHRYAMGLYTEGEKHLYVNVGVGMVGVPIRMVKPEVTLLTLQRTPATT